ncbi:MAG: hypothetical protein A3F72_16050 [Bacteroidetes bacterium RIFCSPLOWO2_12_FULL_35_15]|nr:MAG: hypothetical protein A3F72_16050 [Bacteroidetes bacterium RIFCSPLOWO2_12_FULL_35_15]
MVQCERCEHIQLAFGTTMMVMDRAEFRNFRNAISELAELHKNEPFPESKSITLPTPCRQVHLVFSPKEAEVFNELLDQASLLLEANEILCTNPKHI